MAPSDDLELQAIVKALAVLPGENSYGRFFDAEEPALGGNKVLVVEMKHLPPELRGVLLEWIKRQADRAEAKAKLMALLPHILFDLEAAERGALPPKAI